MSLEDAKAAREARVEKLKVSEGTFLSEGDVITFEVGCGKGHYMSAYAAAHSDEKCVGVDLISERVKDATRRANNRGAGNAYFLKAETREFIEAMPSGVKLRKIFIFFPDPWPKKKHHKRRIISDEFLSMLDSCSTDDAEIFFRTDFREYFDFAIDVFKNSKSWTAVEIKELPFEEVSQFQRILPDFSTLRAIKHP